MMKNTYYLVIALLCYILPIIIFGHWTQANLIYFPFSIALTAYLINLRAIDEKEWPTYLYSFLQGASLSFYGITIFGFTMTGSIVTLSVYWGILVYMISAIPFIVFSRIYRDNKSKDYKNSFNNEQSLEREKKINQLLGIKY